MPERFEQIDRAGLVEAVEGHGRAESLERQARLGV
jgi:hypothetical protein